MTILNENHRCNTSTYCKIVFDLKCMSEKLFVCAPVECYDCALGSVI